MKMRAIYQLLVVSTIVLTFNSCKKDEPEVDQQPVQEIQIVINHSSGSSKFNLIDVFQNPAGNSFKTSTFKYILSNFELVKEDGSSISFNNIELINQESDSSQTFKLLNVPDGNYTAMRFAIGVDSLQNATLVNGGGDLDPSDGMVWTWNTGYIFLKHEGQYLDSAGVWKPYFYHLGTNRGFTEIELPLQSLVMEGKLKTMNLNFDLFKMYGERENLDYRIYWNQQSLGLGDVPWMNALKANLKLSFSVSSIE
jgi:hypothetical protein